jgi:thiamine-phosphate pyrophosphorylase
MVQLREKNTICDSEFIKLSASLVRVLKPFNIPLIINDRVDICLAADAQGVHLGQNDMHPDIARKILGMRAIIGLSLENFDHVYEANKLDSIDYVAASHIFTSKTKPDKTNPECKEVWGIEGVKKLHLLSKYPIMSIGGITLGNVAEVIQAGSKGVAVVSAILEDECPKSAANAFINIINQNLKGNSFHGR